MRFERWDEAEERLILETRAERRSSRVAGTRLPPAAVLIGGARPFEPFQQRNP